MGTPKCTFFWVIVAIWSFSIASSAAANDGYQEDLRIQCGFTRYPTLCVQTLIGLGLGSRSFDFTSALVNKTISESKFPYSNLDKFSSNFISSETQLDQLAISHCHELMKMSLKRLNQALEALENSPKEYKADIQTWLSAAVTFQQSCKDAIEDHGPISNVLLDKISNKMDYLSELSSNSLSLVNRINGVQEKPSFSGRNLHQEENFPHWLSPSDRKLLQTTEIKANAIVANDGSGNYKTISDAIDAAKGGRFVIYVKSGTYSEKVNVNKDGITLIGDGKDSTIITGSSSVAKGSSLLGSSTFTITGDGFIARDIGFRNTAGPLGHQAVALTVAGDHAVLYRCSIQGYQDTLFAFTLRQFYRECDIYGTVDFIFGNAAAVFQSCNLILRRPRSGGAFNTILANGRTDPVKNSYNSYLGRPWKQYSRAVVMQTYIDGEIDSRGWAEWTGSSSSTYRTLYFAEYDNSGPGSGTSGRVKWSGFHVIGTPEATKFTVAGFIGGNSWLPPTGVDFVSGLQ